MNQEKRFERKIRQKYPHLKVLKIGTTKHGTPMAIVQVVDKANPIHGMYALIYEHPISKRLTSSVRSTKIEIIQRAFEKGEI